MALLVAFAAAAILHLNHDPLIAGADTETVSLVLGSTVEPISAPRPESLTDSAMIEDDEAPVAKSDAIIQREMPQGQVLEGRMAILMNLLLFEKAHNILSSKPYYACTFHKQERIGDTLSDEQVINLKLRHAPFSVYMKWVVGDKGREVLYVEGQNDGNMIAHAGGWKARLVPALKLDPNGSMALRESRHPVTQAGMLEIARRGIEYRKRELGLSEGVTCRMVSDQKFNDRPCYHFTTEFASPEIFAEYRKTIVYIDQELNLPIACRNYAWPEKDTNLTGNELDQATLIENYAYTDIQFETELADLDFDHHNEDYKFRR